MFAYCCMLERHTTQALHLQWLIESGTNSVCWVDCLHLVLLHAGETCNTSTASAAVAHWKWNKQCLFILLLIEWSVCISPHTQHKHCSINCDSLKVEETVLLLLLSRVSVLSLIAMCWRDTQHKHYIYCDLLKVEQAVLVITIEWSVCT